MLLTRILPQAGLRARQVPALGYLTNGAREAYAPFTAGFLHGLRDLGYMDGQNLNIQWRFADGSSDRLSMMAAELVALPVDVLVTQVHRP